MADAMKIRLEIESTMCCYPVLAELSQLSGGL